MRGEVPEQWEVRPLELGVQMSMCGRGGSTYSLIIDWLWRYLKYESL